MFFTESLEGNHYFFTPHKNLKTAFDFGRMGSISGQLKEVAIAFFFFFSSEVTLISQVKAVLSFLYLECSLVLLMCDLLGME